MNEIRLLNLNIRWRYMILHKPWRKVKRYDSFSMVMKGYAQCYLEGTCTSLCPNQQKNNTKTEMFPLIIFSIIKQGVESRETILLKIYTFIYYSNAWMKQSMFFFLNILMWKTWSSKIHENKSFMFNCFL